MMIIKHIDGLPSYIAAYYKRSYNDITITLSNEGGEGEKEIIERVEKEVFECLSEEGIIIL